MFSLKLCCMVVERVALFEQTSSVPGSILSSEYPLFGVYNICMGFLQVFWFLPPPQKHAFKWLGSTKLEMSVHGTLGWTASHPWCIPPSHPPRIGSGFTLSLTGIKFASCRYLICPNLRSSLNSASAEHIYCFILSYYIYL